MSNTVHAICKHRRVGRAVSKTVLLLMADFASDDGTGIWASKPNMAADLEISETAVRDAIRHLMAEGIISEVGQRKHQNGYTVEYRIDLARVSALPVTRENAPVLTPASPAPLRQTHPTPTPPAPQDLRETQVNHHRTIIEPPEGNTPAEQVTRKPPKRASALPENWVPSDRNLADARSRNFTDEEIHEQAAAFRDHHLARGTTFKDWDAGWRMWLGNARRFARPAAARNARARSAHDVMLAGFQSAALRDRS
ncbi:helix-turn-helix domain-containing protein [Falsigemmobacter faecalis]|uniref:Helix-turn-helix domain-containing protein n=1 Tax=Falsigemmobacter faecalis TaxID=2488730 RepID=A0A3P3DCF7_9RHOB|nr:helix-turn-helix domain-containing protein [Falsigemmobacter faecalis]RRH72015.1 hypothetical protein EG244_15995 [Falsigemmobacter faecalis]